MKIEIILVLLLVRVQFGLAQIAEMEGNLRISDQLPKIELFDLASGEQRVEGTLGEQANNIELSALIGNLVFKTNGHQRLSIDHQLGTTTIWENLSIRKEVGTPWGNVWTNQDHNKIWLRQSWSGSDLDKLYLGATGAGTNSERGALLITSNNGVMIGKGNDDGTQLSEVNAKVEENGDLWLKGRVKSSGRLIVSAYDFVNDDAGDLHYSRLGVTSNNVISGDDMNMLASISLPIGARITRAQWWGGDQVTSAYMSCAIWGDYLNITNNMQSFPFSESFGSSAHALNQDPLHLITNAINTNVLIQDNYDYYIRCRCEDSDGQRLRAVILDYTFDP